LDDGIAIIHSAGTLKVEVELAVRSDRKGGVIRQKVTILAVLIPLER
jgi:hypothetical protein